MNTKKENKKEVYLILDSIRSNFNVGSIFRIADCSGIKKIFLAGVTPLPIDRFGRDNKELKKVSLGGENNVQWQKCLSALKIVKKLKSEGVQIVSLEQSDGSIDYKKFHPKFPVAVILGNEVDGVNKNILKLSDSIIEIKMLGKKESLNVSVAAAVALFRILNI